MFRFLAYSGPVQLIFLLIVLLSIRLPLLLSDSPLLIEDAHYMVLGERLAADALPYRDVIDTTPPIPAFIYQWIAKFFGRSQTAYFSLSFLLVFIQSLLFRNFCHANQLLTEKGELPTLVYMLLAGIMYDFYSLSPPLMALTFILVAFDRIFRHLRSENSENDIFTTGFYIGMAYLCYEPSVLFMGMAYYTFLLYTRTTFRLYIVMLLGFVFPIVLALMVFFFLDAHASFFEFYLGYIPPKNLFLFNFNIRYAVVITAPGLFLVLLGVLKTFRYDRFVNYQIVSNQILFIWMLFFLIVLILFFSQTTSAYLFLLPFGAYFTTHYLQIDSKWWWTKHVFSLLYIVNMIFVVFSFYKISPYPKDMIAFNNQILWQRKSFLNPPKQKIMVIGSNYTLFANGQLAGPFLDWNRVKEKIGDATTYEQIKIINDALLTDPPQKIYDMENQFEHWSRHIPFLKNHYFSIEPGVFLKK